MHILTECPEALYSNHFKSTIHNDNSIEIRRLGSPMWWSCSELYKKKQLLFKINQTNLNVENFTTNSRDCVHSWKRTCMELPPSNHVRQLQRLRETLLCAPLSEFEHMVTQSFTECESNGLLVGELSLSNPRARASQKKENSPTVRESCGLRACMVLVAPSMIARSQSVPGWKLRCMEN